MTTVFKPLVAAKYAENAQTTQYTAPTATRTLIDKATVTNVSGSSATFTCNIVPSGSTASASNIIIQTRAIADGECYTCPELVGQAIEPGGFISTMAGTASALVLRISGREVT